MSEHEYRRMEWRVGPPPARPFGILVPPGIAELSGAHDLGADPVSELPQDGVVDAAAPAGLAGQLVPPPGDEHPFVQPVAGVAERRLACHALAGAKAVERDGEELDTGERHGSCSFPGCQSVTALALGGPARIIGTYSRSWIRPSNVRLPIPSK